MVSDPLRSGDEVPTHMPVSNVLPVSRYGTVRDAVTGKRLQLIPHEDFFLTVKERHDTLRQESPHLHFYRIVDGRIYHTRDEVVIELE